MNTNYRSGVCSKSLILNSDSVKFHSSARGGGRENSAVSWSATQCHTGNHQTCITPAHMRRQRRDMIQPSHDWQHLHLTRTTESFDHASINTNTTRLSLLRLGILGETGRRYSCRVLFLNIIFSPSPPFHISSSMIAGSQWWGHMAVLTTTNTWRPFIFLLIVAGTN